MSIYKTMHRSSKPTGRQEWMIEELTDPHLCNIVRKMRAEDDLDDEQNLHLSECEAEILRRGLDLSYPNGKPPQAEGTGPAVQ